MSETSIDSILETIQQLSPERRSAFHERYQHLLDEDFARAAAAARKEYTDQGMTDEQIEEMIMNAVYEVRYGRK